MGWDFGLELEYSVLHWRDVSLQVNLFGFSSPMECQTFDHLDDEYMTQEESRTRNEKQSKESTTLTTTSDQNCTANTYNPDY